MLKSGMLAVFSLALAALATQATQTHAQTLSIGDYARRCEKLISDVPAFSCSQGTEIKMRVTGKNVYGEAQCENHGVQSGGLACEPGSRLVRLTPLKNAKDTDILFLCRANKRSKGGYFQIAGLHHNKRTGTTCWYHSLGHGFSTGKNMVSPTNDTLGGDSGDSFRRTLAEETWDKVTRSGPAGDNCSMCHAADPYLLTPFVASVDDKNALPGFEKTPAPTDWYNAPYSNYTVEVSPGVRVPNWRPNWRTKAPTGHACSSCHGFAGFSLATKLNLFPLSIGRRKSRYNSDHQLWMPLVHGNFTRTGVYADLSSLQKDGVAAVERCYEDFSQLAITKPASQLTPDKRAEVMASHARCGWHLSSIELAAADIEGIEWEDNTLRGRFVATNTNRFNARGVKLELRLKNPAPKAGPVSATDVVDIKPNNTVDRAFALKGGFPDAAIAVLELWVDANSDPDLKEGEFIEADENDNRLTRFIQLNDFSSKQPKSVIRPFNGSVTQVPFTVRNDGNLPAKGVITRVSVTTAGMKSLSSCVRAWWRNLDPDWKPQEARQLTLFLSNRCEIRNRTVDITVEADAGKTIPERTHVNNIARFSFRLPDPPPPAPRPGGPSGNTPTVDFFKQLLRTRSVFLGICKYVLVTPDNSFCTGLERLPTVRNPEDIVVPGPIPIPTPFLDEILVALMEAGDAAGIDPDLHYEAVQAVERALSGEEFDLEPVTSFLSISGENLFADALPRHAFQESIDGGVELGPGWTLVMEPAPGYLALRPSDVTLPDYGQAIDGVPFMWIHGSTDRPQAFLSIDLGEHEIDGTPHVIAMIDGVLGPVESDWNEELRQLTAQIPSATTGIGIVTRPEVQSDEFRKDSGKDASRS